MFKRNKSDFRTAFNRNYLFENKQLLMRRLIKTKKLNAAESL